MFFNPFQTKLINKIIKEEISEILNTASAIEGMITGEDYSGSYVAVPNEKFQAVKIHYFTSDEEPDSYPFDENGYLGGYFMDQNRASPTDIAGGSPQYFSMDCRVDVGADLGNSGSDPTDYDTETKRKDKNTDILDTYKDNNLIMCYYNGKTFDQDTVIPAPHTDDDGFFLMAPVGNVSSSPIGWGWIHWEGTGLEGSVDFSDFDATGACDGTQCTQTLPDVVMNCDSTKNWMIVFTGTGYMPTKTITDWGTACGGWIAGSFPRFLVTEVMPADITGFTTGTATANETALANFALHVADYQNGNADWSACAWDYLTSQVRLAVGYQFKLFSGGSWIVGGAVEAPGDLVLDDEGIVWKGSDKKAINFSGCGMIGPGSGGDGSLTPSILFPMGTSASGTLKLNIVALQVD